MIPRIGTAGSQEDYGYISERFRGPDIDEFDVEKYLQQRKTLVAQQLIPGRDAPSKDGIVGLSPWHGGNVDPDQFPCVTNLPSPAPWHIQQGQRDVQLLRTEFLSKIDSVSDVRKLYYKGWLSNRDALDAFMILWHRSHSLVEELNQHDAVMFGFKDPRVDVKKAMKLGQAYNVFDYAKFLYEPFVYQMLLEPNTSGEMQFSVQGNLVRLKTNGKEVFPPSNTGMLFAENIVVKPGEHCFDVGVGSGMQGIVMAKLGGIVKGSDVNKTATEYSEENAKRSGVGDKMTVAQGEFFAGADEDEQFDVIVANLNQTPAEETGEHGWAHAIDAGADGVAVLEKFLETTVRENRLKPGGRLYICAASIANSQRLRLLIEQHFTCRKIAEQQIRVPEYVEKNGIEYLERLTRDGIIDVVRLGDELWPYSKDTLLELKLAV